MKWSFTIAQVGNACHISGIFNNFLAADDTSTTTPAPVTSKLSQPQEPATSQTTAILHDLNATEITNATQGKQMLQFLSDKQL